MFRNKEKTPRYCRCGAGIEKNVGEGDTTGFELLDTDKLDMDKHRDYLVLKLKRNHSRLKQTSIPMLQSWRANCDVQVIIYQSNPKELDVYDIARVTSYVVSYTCKGSETSEQEADAIKGLILASEPVYVEDQEYDLARAFYVVKWTSTTSTLYRTF